MNLHVINRLNSRWEKLLIGRKRPGLPILIGLIDIALVATAILMVTTEQTVLFFHLIFVFLALGAFFWQPQSFTIRAVLWVLLTTAEVLGAVYQGSTQVEELIEIPLLTLVLLLVFAIARHRARAQQQALALNEQLGQRLAELDAANKALRQEADARARLQEETLRAHEHYTQMVIHDLKNPLTAIRGYLDILHLTSLTSEQYEVVASAKRGSARMLDLVTDMLDVARFREGRLDLRCEPTPIGTLLEDCIRELQPLIELESRQVSLNVPDAVLTFPVDAGLMRRVIANLLSNAIKHTTPSTQVRLGVEPDSAGGLQLWVEDTGAGIPLEQQPALFERFSAMAQGAARRNSTGLGLAFCKLAVEAHGGKIAVRSVPGAGTTFTVVLPPPQMEARELGGAPGFGDTV